MEIQFLHEEFTKKDPKLLIDHVQRMMSGEAPLFSTTLSLVYDRLLEQAFPEDIPFDPSLTTHTGDQNIRTSPPPKLESRHVGRGVCFTYIEEPITCEDCENMATCERLGRYPKCLDHTSFDYSDEAELFGPYNWINDSFKDQWRNIVDLEGGQK